MRVRRQGRLAVLATGVLALVGGLAAAPGPAATAAGQTVSISALPPVAQPGKQPAAADAARTVVAVRVEPATVGRKVTLTRLGDRGWRSVGSTTLTSRGLAEFSVDTLVSGQPVAYRAVVATSGTLPATTTATVWSTSWGTPDFTDEFAGAALGPAWSLRGTDYNPAALRACSKASAQAVQVAGGTVRLSVLVDPARSDLCTARRRDGSVLGEFPYRLNGHISTQHSVDLTYGVAAARIRFHEKRGQHAAFWLQPTTQVPGASSAAQGGAEIDVIEWFGVGGPNGELSSTVYHPTPAGQERLGGWVEAANGYLASKSDSWFAAYHVFSVEWTPTEYVFRIDGRETWRTSAGVSGVPEYPILSLLSSDSSSPNLPSPSDLPQHLYVDWVRLWGR